MGQQRRVDLVLVLGVRTHGGVVGSRSIQSAKRIGLSAGVVVTTMSARWTASCASTVADTAMPSSAVSSAATFEARSGSRAQIRASQIGRTRVSAFSWSRACVPAPRIAATVASPRERCRAATAPPPPCVSPSDSRCRGAAPRQVRCSPKNSTIMPLRRADELRVVEEAGADLDGEPGKSRHVGRLHVHLAAMLGYVEPQDRRHGDGLRRERGEAVLDAADSREVERYERAQVGSVRMRIVGIRRPPPARPRRSGCGGGGPRRCCGPSG